MKEILLPKTYTASITFKPSELPEPDENGIIKIGTIMPVIGSEEEKELNRTLQLNVAEIISSAISITTKIEGVIYAYLFQSNPYPTEEQNFFRTELLESSILSYHHKKELLQAILKRREYIQGKDKNKLQNNLTKIEEWRNAFAHGKTRFDNKEGLVLDYYRNRAKVTILNDEFWGEVEQTFRDTHKILDSIRPQQSNNKIKTG